MHAAPPVRVDLGRSYGWVCFAGLAAAAAAANGVAWVALSFDVPMAGALAAASAVAVALWGARSAWQAQAPGALAWDGGRWHWVDRPGQVRVTIDLDAWILLRFDAEDGTRAWIAASRRSCHGPWGALRAALYSPRPADRLDAPPA